MYRELLQNDVGTIAAANLNLQGGTIKSNRLTLERIDLCVKEKIYMQFK